MGLPLLKPSLYTQGAAEPVLLGGACRCGYHFFPMQTLGCERCGQHGDALSPRSFRASGALLTATIVHMHHDKRRPTPFAIGTIKLDDGPVVRALLSETSLANELGTRVQAELVEVLNQEGAAALDLRFKRAVA